MSALSAANYQRQIAANTPKTRTLHGTGIKIRSTETDTKKLFNHFKQWAEKYRVTYLQAFCLFYYGMPEFMDYGNEDDYDIARAKLAEGFGRLSLLTITFRKQNPDC